ncbi:MULTISPECIES: glycoside hydrolase family 57 protein [unclassified Candidatus Frackibacter]|uniref:glycoside hydrolase family 57 protein n=1 Tax=unclassified Candidatus Frackibacter TaxID=2648818 RepID=UPI0008829518|nr:MULTISPECIES: 1,4-alpha-glucan branching protein domain-containing protein [unclassified Candidatus Frackibacter]SDC70629.1 1,4-alpha-glucan branching enzyme [Candidatus Frackibacter sp. WG11]SEM84877.1 1,4-alpha-glucan branching enzyme [Candidatus Frackibacter sp. WG12]SFL94112.1 1,4-alpha-glucan branching enzyme [Candidatus Frackibacter sp. WG13]
MEKGYLSLVLHAHLPYVRHPEKEDIMEEEWLYEAITETYIPLINVFDGLLEDGVDFNLTLSVSPPLLSMLTDPLLQERYLRHINNLIELADKEVERTKTQPEYHQMAQQYAYLFKEARYVFEEKYDRNLVNAFKKFQYEGYLEVITSSATHAFLPFFDIYPEAVNAQVELASTLYKKYFGTNPAGMWLPECAYQPGQDRFLAKHDIKYFFTDAHGVLHADTRPKYGVFAPIYTPNGVAAFGRDLESSKQVWSAKEGYPGDYDYREFYRDIGYDLDYDYVEPYIHQSGIRKHTGIKYYRITGETDYKEPYNPDWATHKAGLHADDFISNRQKQISYLTKHMDRKPIVTAPYDAELFGHWWYEGIQWLDFLIRKIAYDQDTISLITPSQYLNEYKTNQVTTPSYSSWGHKGYGEVWLEGSNDWTYRHLHWATEKMVEIANDYPDATGLKYEALNQLARELLLAQSSDWPFIMKTGTMVEYAVKRVKTHITRFKSLYQEIKDDNINLNMLRKIQSYDNIFPDIDYRIYRSDNISSKLQRELI